MLLKQLWNAVCSTSHGELSFGAAVVPMRVGKRQRVDIKNIWKKETEFSNWLATDDGLDLIEQDLGIRIVDARREARAGDFPCDIVGRLAQDEDHVVVVENQYGRTNHDHLGKLLTYAAVHKAMTGIWISEQTSDDHRQVIDWLNQNTPPTVALYLAELTAYTIGDSAAAPQLDIVCQPNMTVKLTHADQSDAEKARHAWRIHYWEDIQAAIRLKKPPFNLQKPGPEHWSSVSIGRSGFSMNMLLTPIKRTIGVEIYIDPRGWAKEAFFDLLAQREQIEAEMGEPLAWREIPEKRCSRVLLEVQIDPRNEDNRAAICDWFADAAPRLYRAFRERVVALRAPAAGE
ncbi:MAG TPA: DUF4268 domain-containing protein [Fimbriimonas sp.]|nr:DUF4268 domain-containing protein [Fimbriimonas sp.]